MHEIKTKANNLLNFQLYNFGKYIKKIIYIVN